MLDPALTQYRFLQSLADELLADLPPDDAFTPACPGGHHPAWILGHLTFSGLAVVKLLGGDASGFEGASRRFGRGSEPEPGGDDFDAVRAGWDDAHLRAEASAAEAGPERLGAPNPLEDFRAQLPTLGDEVVFLLTGHEAFHLGQLSAWRRARGRKRLF